MGRKPAEARTDGGTAGFHQLQLRAASSDPNAGVLVAHREVGVDPEHHVVLSPEARYCDVTFVELRQHGQHVPIEMLLVHEQMPLPLEPGQLRAALGHLLLQLRVGRVDLFVGHVQAEHRRARRLLLGGFHERGFAIDGTPGREQLLALAEVGFGAAQERSFVLD